MGAAMSAILHEMSDEVRGRADVIAGLISVSSLELTLILWHRTPFTAGYFNLYDDGLTIVVVVVVVNDNPSTVTHSNFMCWVKFF